MDEVDKIIFQSLRKIGCEIDNDILSLDQFQPELLVRAASLCLQQIRTNASNTLPSTLPQNMAQRFVVATAIAEACTAAGYRSDIGYQTFLYPNKVEARRLFMFLIERLSKYNSLQPEKQSNGATLETNLERMQQDFKSLILQDLKQPWLPVFCTPYNQTLNWQPNLNLSIKADNQTPNIFQQTVQRGTNLSCTVLHKNAIDYHAQRLLSDKLTYMPLTPTRHKNAIISMQQVENDAKIVNPVKKLEDAINSLQDSNEKSVEECQDLQQKIANVKKQQGIIKEALEDFKKLYKVKQRTNVVLESPEENVPKLETLVSKTKARRQQLEQQWKEYREPLLVQLKQLKSVKDQNNVLTEDELQATIVSLEAKLLQKRAEHAALANELKIAQSSTVNPITREEYMRRLKEFSGNIRKQQNDICKVLEDIRDIQKQINTVDAQLQRQFSYTDDLLFQTAQSDAQSKRAYQLLITLHASCTKLVELTMLAGSISKQVRELEVQIDREKDKNVASSLEKISADILNIENAIKSIQTEISKEENKITKG